MADPGVTPAAQAAAEALVYGQLQSGGWAQVIDFDPRGTKAGQYRNGKARGRNYSTFDDGISQSALRFLMHCDKALGFKHAAIHDASEFALKAVLGEFSTEVLGSSRVLPAVLERAQFRFQDPTIDAAIRTALAS